MKPKSARSLMWFSIILLLVGGMANNPAATVLCAGVAALCAVAPVAVGPRGPRLAGVAILLASLGLGVAYFPAAKQHMDAYRGRAARAGTPLPPQPAQHK